MLSSSSAMRETTSPSREAAKECSPRRKSWVRRPEKQQAPLGAKEKIGHRKNYLLVPIPELLPPGISTHVTTVLGKCTTVFGKGGRLFWEGHDFSRAAKDRMNTGL
jgi:hypothetical protein